MDIRTLTIIKPIDKGWSGDQKYCAVDTQGNRVLLRLAPAEQHTAKLQELALMRQLDALGIPMCRPLDAGLHNGQAYAVHTWIDGADTEDVIPTLPEKEQYALGVEAGQILARIHTIPAPEDTAPWAQRFGRKIDRKIQLYHACPIRFDGGAALLAYVEANRHLINCRPQCFQHGDYHIGNMMLSNDGRLCVIDFGRFDIGDPWEEFNRITWSAQKSPAFASGLVDGYFDGNVPQVFWQTMALYIAVNALANVPWAIPFGQEEVNVMLAQNAEILTWYQGMTTCIPAWYRSYR